MNHGYGVPVENHSKVNTVINNFKMKNIHISSQQRDLLLGDTERLAACELLSARINSHDATTWTLQSKGCIPCFAHWSRKCDLSKNSGDIEFFHADRCDEDVVKAIKYAMQNNKPWIRTKNALQASAASAIFGYDTTVISLQKRHHSVV